MTAMREAETSRTYDTWSRAYDNLFGRLVHKRQIRALEQLHFEPGDTVLDVGVGTGMLLRHYPRDVTVVACDLSAGMLAKAAEKKREQGLEHCHLLQADAMLPPFADASFDHIVITHVISVVSDPSKLMKWAARLLKPGGRIVVLNHFQSTQPVVAWFERLISPLCVKLGWRTDLSIEACFSGAGLDLEYCFQLRRADLWKILVFAHARPGSEGMITPRRVVIPRRGRPWLVIEGE